MNSYKFSLKQYKAVSKAEIDLNGITVLAGENGAGKSTITRWFYYLVEVIAKYDWFVYDDLRQNIYTLLRDFRIGIRDMSVEDEGIFVSITRWNMLAKSIDYHDEEGVAKVVNNAKEIIFRVADFLQTYLSDDNKRRRRVSRMMLYLGVDDAANFDRDMFISQNMLKVESSYEQYQDRMHKHSVEDLFDFIRQHYDRTIKRSPYVRLAEDKVPIIEKQSFGHIVGLQQAIYIDTPMMLVNEHTTNRLWNAFSDLLDTPNENFKISLEVKKMLYRIQHIIRGTVKYKEDDFVEELRYIREDNLDISLDEAATGIKSFAYIIRLLENGYLNKNTLLVIDEPEAHLHPQWIVAYARILVLLTKELGVRVLLASHNPDMVAAIQSIGEKEGIKELISFYQAYPSQNPYEYEYRNLGFEVTEIFKSFNIAISRIQDYGKSDNQ